MAMESSWKKMEIFMMVFGQMASLVKALTRKKMDQNIKDPFKMAISMDKAFLKWQMDPFSRAIGQTIISKATVNIFGLMEKSMSVTGKTINLKEWEYILIKNQI
jgi:hypothetical protein